MSDLIKTRQQAETMYADITHLHEKGHWPSKEIPSWVINSDNPVIKSLYVDGYICPGIENYVVYKLMKYFHDGDM